MKSLNKSVVLSLISAFLAPALLVAQGGPVAQVLSEDPDGAIIVRAGSSMAIGAGDVLQEGDVIKTNGATVIASICDGALITLYPGTEVALSGLGTGMAQLNLKSGELLGDSISGCGISVSNVVGTTNISNGVYGVLLTQSGEGWTLQVRNLDGNVTFTGADGLDTGSMAVSLVEAGKPVDVPVGEEMIIRGIFDSGSNVFSVLSGGAALAMMSDDTVSQMRNDSGEMNSYHGGAPVVEEAAQEEGPAPEMIEIPWREVETASEKG